jgi:uncharacterized SAM-binding protein YcdF (DUF218 family)
MFIFLSKIIPPLLYPVGFSCLLLLLSLVLIRKQGWHKFLLITALFVLLLGGNRWVAYSLVRSLEWQYISSGEFPQEPVIVLLGGSTHSAIYPRQTVEVSSSGDRIFYSFWLYKQGKASHLLLSGGNIDWLSPDKQPAEDMAWMLESLGVPAEAIWLEKSSLNTYENALYSKQILDTKGIQRIILVTSAIHMPRSVKLFEKQGLDVIPAPTDFTVTQAGWDQLMHPSLATLLANLIPAADNLNLTAKALKEYLGIFIYSLKGWM